MCVCVFSIKAFSNFHFKRLYNQLRLSFDVQIVRSGWAWPRWLSIHSLYPVVIVRNVSVCLVKREAFKRLWRGTQNKSLILCPLSAKVISSCDEYIWKNVADAVLFFTFVFFFPSVFCFIDLTRIKKGCQSVHREHVCDKRLDLTWKYSGFNWMLLCSLKKGKLMSDVTAVTDVCTALNKANLGVHILSHNQCYTATLLHWVKDQMLNLFSDLAQLLSVFHLMFCYAMLFISRYIFLRTSVGHLRVMMLSDYWLLTKYISSQSTLS